jgi:hypothetical protein
MAIESLSTEESRRDERRGEERAGTTADTFEELALTVDGSNGLLVEDAFDLLRRPKQDADTTRRSRPT